MENDIAFVVDLGRDVEGDAGEKRVCRVMVGVVTVPVPLVVVEVEILVTKQSSDPTLSTAFWLLRVAVGVREHLDVPWVSRKETRAAKSRTGRPGRKALGPRGGGGNGPGGAG